MLTYALNILKLLRGDHRLDPRVVIFYVSGQCNLNCSYCEDFGARRNSHTDKPVPLEDAQKILAVIRDGTDSLMLTGGEPLLHPDIDEIVRFAKADLGFHELTMITNASLLDRHEVILPHIDRLIISLDLLDAETWSSTINVSQVTSETILANIRYYTSLQKKFGYTLILNTVLSPQTITGALDVLDFCEKHGLLASFSPQAVNNWPHYDLLVSEDYKSLLRTLIERKKSGAPILGSLAYLQNLLDMTPYDCYPLLAPRIMPDGGLAYPCRPLEKANNGQGGRPVNFLEVSNWDEAWATANVAYGQPPLTCYSCYQQCYAEPSLMQAKPLSLLWETIRYPASRKGRLTTYAPG